MGGSTVPGTPSAPHRAGISCAQARRLARDLLDGLDTTPEQTADVLTVVTELASNAQRHAGGVTGFTLTHRAGVVRVEVSDASPHPPEARPWAPAEPGGFGWLLVNRLADTQVRHTAGGKTVIAEMPVGP
ncbi:ATP-binding protein [Streptomyces sp. NPDC097619]|uniref:ATP-binding protein n=1 Tax=Streptomyces sp. NPDC097619 TaxID=3157228 RepID=UPI00331E305C